MAVTLPDGTLIRCIMCGAPEYQGGRKGPFEASRSLHGGRAHPLGVCGRCHKEVVTAVYRSWLLRRFTAAQRKAGPGLVVYTELVESARQLAAAVGPYVLAVVDQHDGAIRQRLGVGPGNGPDSAEVDGGARVSPERAMAGSP